MIFDVVVVVFFFQIKTLSKDEVTSIRKKKIKITSFE
jgi:hypothetical protein